MGWGMSKFVGLAVNPLNGSKEKIFEGWNWPAFFFGIIWCMAKGLWKQAAIIFAIVFVGLFIPVVGWLIAIGTWFYLGANGNEMVLNSLLQRGYVPEGQESRSSPQVSLRHGVRSEPSQDHDPIEQLATLHGLFQSGILTESEYLAQKNRILDRT